MNRNTPILKAEMSEERIEKVIKGIKYRIEYLISVKEE